MFAGTMDILKAPLESFGGVNCLLVKPLFAGGWGHRGLGKQFFHTDG
jgi:hypothetical protein